mgnify:CR=1 FL=1
MTTQYSPILKLALPVQGELSGTWGDVVNDNITSMVEQAIAGRAVINTWTTNAHTLTSANGTTSESRCAMLELTDSGSALSGAATVICPALSKIYIVKNASGQNATVKTPSGTGILVPNGRTTFLFCDGTNVIEAMTHTTSLQLGTSTTVTAVLDEDNMASDSPTSLATQQSIKAYVDAQVGAFDSLAEVLAVGNTTGSNNIVVDNGQKATATTLTANTNLTIAGTVTVASILDEDNMGSDSATSLATQQSIKAYVDAQVGTVDTLAEVLANGNTTGGTDIVVSVDDVISMDNGTNALPSLTTTGDLNTGIYFPAADQVGVTAGGTQRLNVTTTGITVTGVNAATSYTGDGSTLTNVTTKTGTTGSSLVAAGTTAQRDGTPSAGMLRFNSTDTSFEGYDGSAWGSIGGGASGGGSNAVFYENDQTVTANYTIPADKNAMSTGPITVNSGITVTVSDGARYVVI